MVKLLLIIFGTISLFLGILGIFIPGLPTTPFLLLTAGLYVRSSEKLYHLLLNNKYLGPYINEFRTNKGLTRMTKFSSICIMWVMISISTIFFLSNKNLKLIIIAIGIIGTIVMGFIIPTTNKNNDSNKF